MIRHKTIQARVGNMTVWLIYKGSTWDIRMEVSTPYGTKSTVLTLQPSSEVDRILELSTFSQYMGEIA